MEGPKGKLQWEHRPEVTVDHDAAAKALDGRARQRRAPGPRPARPDPRRAAKHVVGVTQGYERRLEIVGVGYLAAVQGQVLQLRVGLANEIQVPIPAGLKVACPDQQHIVIQGIDKQMVGAVCRRGPRPAEARALQGQGHPLRGRGGPPQAGQGHGEVSRQRCDV